MTFKINWIWRSRHRAQQPPNPDYPYGIALDVSKGEQPACLAMLPYPAEGVGTWIVKCEACGVIAGVTAAGRVDDPTQVLIACARGEAI